MLQSLSNQAFHKRNFGLYLFSLGTHRVAATLANVIMQLPIGQD